MSGCLVPDEDAIFSIQAIWAFLIREQGTGQPRVPGDLKFYTEPVMTGPGEVTFLGRGWLEENQMSASLTEKRTRGKVLTWSRKGHDGMADNLGAFWWTP